MSARAISALWSKSIPVAASAAFALALCLSYGSAHAQSYETVSERLDRLERENRQLRREVDALKGERTLQRKAEKTGRGTESEGEGPGYVRVDPDYGYAILDPTTDINRKQRLILGRKRNGTLVRDTVHVQGAVTAVADFQTSNRADKFGYLMRHPTASN